jgi:hypothetical protein
MSKHFSLITPIFNILTANQYKSQQTNNFNERQESKLAQLEDDLMADDNQAVSNLVLYLYS